MQLTWTQEIWNQWVSDKSQPLFYRIMVSTSDGTCFVIRYENHGSFTYNTTIGEGIANLQSAQGLCQNDAYTNPFPPV